MLESKFLVDAQQTCCFELEEYQYELNFTTMRQRNLRTGTDREVCRRPCFVSELDLKTGGLYALLFEFRVNVFGMFHLKDKADGEYDTNVVI